MIALRFRRFCFRIGRVALGGDAAFDEFVEAALSELVDERFVRRVGRRVLVLGTG
jgi:hypothetical protein